MLTPRVSRTFSSAPARTLAGVTFDGLSVLSFDGFVCDPAARVVTISYWLKTMRVRANVGASFGEVFSFYDQPTSATLQIATLGKSSLTTIGSPAFLDWAQSPINNYRKLYPGWPGGGSEVPTGGTDGGIYVEDTPNDDLWMMVLLTLDTSMGGGVFNVGTAYVNGQNVNYSANSAQVLSVDTALLINGLSVGIGGSTIAGDTDFFTGEFANLWAGVGVDLRELDGTFSDATIAKFMGAGNRPVYLGDAGERVTGSAADIYCSRFEDEPAAAFFVNKGTGGGPFTETVGGPVTISTTPIPGPEPRPTPLAWNVTGGLNEGDTLTVHTAWTNGPLLTQDYQWQSLGADEGANQPTYASGPADVGFTVNCYVIASNASGSFLVNSKLVGPITP